MMVINYDAPKMMVIAEMLSNGGENAIISNQTSLIQTHSPYKRKRETDKRQKNIQAGKANAAVTCEIQLF